MIANGVTINSGAVIALSGQTQGTLKQGFVLTLIGNTSANPISGTFANMADGGIVTINGNNFQASYSGGWKRSHPHGRAVVFSICSRQSF